MIPSMTSSIAPFQFCLASPPCDGSRLPCFPMNTKHNYRTLPSAPTWYSFLYYLLIASMLGLLRFAYHSLCCTMLNMLHSLLTDQCLTDLTTPELTHVSFLKSSSGLCMSRALKRPVSIKWSLEPLLPELIQHFPTNMLFAESRTRVVRSSGYLSVSRSRKESFRGRKINFQGASKSGKWFFVA